VLVVDDEPLIRDFLADGLADAGYRVVTAADGAAAIDHMRSQQLDAVLLDLLMPGMDGLTFLRERQTQPGLAAVPVVVLSAGGIDAIRQAAKLRATAVLSKPLNLDVLASVLAHVMRDSRRVRERQDTARTAARGRKRSTTVQPLGLCPICHVMQYAAMDPALTSSARLENIHALRQMHVLDHSAAEITRVPLRKRLLDLPRDRRRILSDWVYHELRHDWGDRDSRAVHSIDQALDTPAVHRLWQDATRCAYAACRHQP
jgi:CheY-like chemotaxis protein